MLMEWVLNRQTGGSGAIGGDVPYDDYNLQGTIGGLGAFDGPVAEDWADSGISGSQWGTGANENSATQPYFPPPEMAQYSGGRPVGTPNPQLMQLLQAMQQGADYGAGSGLQGLFGGGGPQIERPQMHAPPVAAPVAGTNNTVPYGAPSGDDRDRMVQPRQGGPSGMQGMPNYAAPGSNALDAARYIARVATPKPSAPQYTPIPKANTQQYIPRSNAPAPVPTKPTTQVTQRAAPSRLQTSGNPIFSTAKSRVAPAAARNKR